LIGHQIQSFENRTKFLRIGAPYICIIDCVKKEFGSETLIV
jgi:hypothetical protein